MFFLVVILLEGVGQWLMGRIAERYHWDDRFFAWARSLLGWLAVWSDIILHSDLFWVAVGFCGALWVVRFFPAKNQGLTSSCQGKSDEWLLPEIIARRLPSKELVEAWKRDGPLEQNTDGYRAVAAYLRDLLIDGKLVARGQRLLIDPKGNRTVDHSFTEINRSEWQRLGVVGQKFCMAFPLDGNSGQYVSLEMREVDDVAR